MPAGFSGTRTFYRYFSTQAEEDRRVAWLQRNLMPPTEVFLKRYFVWVKPLIPSLPSGLRYFLEKCYPHYELTNVQGAQE